MPVNQSKTVCKPKTESDVSDLNRAGQENDQSDLIFFQSRKNVSSPLKMKVIHQQSHWFEYKFIVYPRKVNKLDQDTCYLLLKRRCIHIRLLFMWQYQLYDDSATLKFLLFDRQIVNLRRDFE
jgi:hypothetical protein